MTRMSETAPTFSPASPPSSRLSLLGYLLHLAKLDTLLPPTASSSWPGTSRRPLEAASLSEAKLWEEVVQEVWLLLAPAVSSHISGWLEEWREVFCPLAGILHLVLEAF